MDRETKDSNFNRNLFSKNIENKCINEEVRQIAEADYKYGLTEEQIMGYVDSRLGTEQVRIYSLCLREDIPKEAIHVITKSGLSFEQMKMSLDFYRKGVTLEDLKAITALKESTMALKLRFKQALSAMSDAAKEAEKEKAEPEYVKEILNKIMSVVEEIKCNDKKYEEIIQSIEEIKSTPVQNQMEDEERDKLLKEIAEKEHLLSTQQDELNRLNSQLIRNRKDTEKMEKENRQLREQIEKNQKQPEVTQQQRYYSVPLGGRESYQIQTERYTNRKKSGLVSLFAKLNYKKKSEQSLVKMVVEGGLDTEQIELIREAMEVGVDDKRIEYIIDNKVPAEKIRSVIRVALLEQARM